MANSTPSTLWTIALIVVVLLVFAGFIRLVLDQWSYLALIVVGAAAAYYLYVRVQQAPR